MESSGIRRACCCALLDARVGAILPCASWLCLALCCMSAVSRAWPVQEPSAIAALRRSRTLSGWKRALRALASNAAQVLSSRSAERA
eukprot:72892-Amphidinium_carterae.1